MKKFKIVVSILISIVIVVSLFLYFYHFPTQINATYPAIECADNKLDSMQNTNVHVEGTYYRPLFRDSYFKGKLSIDKYDYTKTEDLWDIVFLYIKFYGYYGMLSYGGVGYNEVGQYISNKLLGDIHIKENFDKIVITIYNDDPQQEEQFRIYAPAKTEDDIRKMRDEMVTVNKQSK